MKPIIFSVWFLKLWVIAFVEATECFYDRQVRIKLHICIKQAFTEEDLKKRGEIGHAWIHDSMKQNKGEFLN